MVERVEGCSEAANVECTVRSRSASYQPLLHSLLKYVGSGLNALFNHPLVISSNHRMKDG